MIYLAEDQPGVASLMTTILRAESGIETLWMKNGLEAYLEVTEAPPALLVADVLLPSLNGLALTRLLKGHDDFAAIPILVVSSVTDPTIRAQALEAGADGFLAKPFEVEAFAEEVRRLMRRSALPGAA
jgi:two-component system response regulator MprA